MFGEHTHVANQKQPTDWATRAVIVVWLSALAVGWCMLESFNQSVNEPLHNGLADSWPAHAAVARTPGRQMLLLFLHPKCPCSRASVRELGQLFTELGSASDSCREFPELIVVATVPEAADESWTQTETLSAALTFPNARLYIDRAGVEAAKFGATTSGLVMLFDQMGNRLYGGGVTVARAHEGANAGCDVLLLILCGDRSSSPTMPVFGCRLCLPENNLPAAAVASAPPM